MSSYIHLDSVLGEPAAAALCRERGGRSVYIPESGTGSLGSLLDAGKADRLREVFGAGVTVPIPLGPHSARACAKRRGLELLRKGLPRADVARELRVHPRTVKRWSTGLHAA